MNNTVHPPRLNYGEQSPELLKKLQELSMAIDKSGQLEPLPGYLVDIRASQMNGCGPPRWGAHNGTGVLFDALRRFGLPSAKR